MPARNSPTTDRPAGMPNASERRFRYWQFSLRGLFVFITLLAVGLGWLSVKADHARRQRAAVEALGATRFFYDFQRSPDADSLFWPGWDENAKPPGPAILRWLWGEHVLANIVALDLSKDDERADLTPNAIREIATLDTLEYLDLTFQPIGDRELEPLRGLSRVKLLNLSNTQISDAGLERLSGMTRLEELDVSGTKISGVGLIHLRTCKYLATLDIIDVPISAAAQGRSGIWPRSNHCMHFCTDSKGAPIVGNEILESCSRLPYLDYMSIGSRPVTDEGVRHLRGLPCLEALCLDNTEITDEALAHIATLQSLTYLDISRTKVTDAGVSSLSSLENLKDLDLSYDRITDVSIGRLSALEHLVGLELTSTLVTDACVNGLRNLPSLEWCCTDNTMVTPEGCKHIEAVLQPNLKRR